MAESTVITPYSTALPFIAGDIPSWLDEYNAQRLAAYDLYDDMYNNSPSTKALLLRGSDTNPIYVPTAKRLIKTLARYVGKNWGFVVDPSSGTTAQQELAKSTFGSLFARERILSQFVNGKREWLRRGDWIWFVTGDPLKPEGSRLSIRTVDPRMYFPLSSEIDADRLTGAMIVEEMLGDDNSTIVLKMQRWLKPIHEEHPQFGSLEATEVAYESMILEIADWQDIAKRKILSVPTPLAVLPGITAIPLYHIKNGTSTADPFGESELKGLESMLAGINQAATDEDLALAIAGMGMFETDATRPDSGWNMGPLAVVEHAIGTKFNKLEGVKSIVPQQTHIGYLEEQAYGTSGINDIALGSRGSVTESGIALSIRMSPLFDEADDKDLQINDVMTQLFHDLATMWLPLFEGVNLGEVIVTSETDTGNRLPFDRSGRWTELVAGFEAGIFSLNFVHRVLVEDFGYDLTSADLSDALEQSATRAAQADPFGARATAELNAEPDPAAE